MLTQCRNCRATSESPGQEQFHHYHRTTLEIEQAASPLEDTTSSPNTFESSASLQHSQRYGSESHTMKTQNMKPNASHQGVASKTLSWTVRTQTTV